MQYLKYLKWGDSVDMKDILTFCFYILYISCPKVLFFCQVTSCFSLDLGIVPLWFGPVPCVCRKWKNAKCQGYSGSQARCRDIQKWRKIQQFKPPSFWSWGWPKILFEVTRRFTGAFVHWVLLTASWSRIGHLHLTNVVRPPLTSSKVGLQANSLPLPTSLCFDVHQCLPCRSKSMLIQLSITSFDEQTKLSFVWLAHRPTAGP